MITEVLLLCNNRFLAEKHKKPCTNCTYNGFCPNDCENCLDYIHTPSHAPDGAPRRKYDCPNMADFYTCKYSCRYTSELIHALCRLKDLSNKKTIKVLSFGCGPCTDLFALDYLKKNNEWIYEKLEYRGIDYSKDVWVRIHSDIKTVSPSGITAKYFYKDMCDFVDVIGEGAWIPDLVTFQYVLSDLRKNSDATAVTKFIEVFSAFANDYMPQKSYMVLNDANFGIAYGGGREYFDRLFSSLTGFLCIKGRFHNENSRSVYYPRSQLQNYSL